MPSGGNVAVRLRLSASRLRALKRVTTLRFTVRVTVGATPFTTKLKLRPPKRPRPASSRGAATAG